ncbi:MAG: hypothetical protein ABIQ27_13265 [Flavobacterium sp.]|uniref:hypothetical protein n=1 Tax=Flavobacterium sp. TaxID=239 RepID=UPI00326342E9
MAKRKFLIFLFFYHLVFTILSYQYALNHLGDSHLYWAKTFNINKYFWFDFAGLNTNFILFLNFPFIKLGLPFWFGYLLYGTIGFLGFLKFIDWAELAFGDSFKFRGINLLYFIFLLPNLHFWTAALGKEPLVFYGIASVFYALISKKYLTPGFIIGSLLLIFIRPHVALMLLSSVAVVLVFQKKYPIKKRISFFLILFSFCSVLLYLSLKLSHIKYLDWNRIQYFNQYSILSFKNSGSYVPMLEYNYFHRLFVFNFQPLFFDAYATLSLLASFENALIILIYLTALYFVLRFYSKIDFMEWMKIAFVFALISSLIYVQRYANLGIFMRTKIMFQPFVLIALLCIIKQGFLLKNAKD